MVNEIFGTHDEKTVQQLQNCAAAEEGALGVLCADGHLGYSMPIGGVVAYRDHISPSGVGYDIACGNYAVKTDIRASQVSNAERERIADEIQRRISFGIGRANDEKVDDPVFDLIRQSPIPQQRALLQLAQNQLGTVGSGNHYVDLLEDLMTDSLWVGVHFGSRGFGHKTATMFMNVAQGLPIDAKGHDGEMMAPPLLLDIHALSGQDYIAAMEIAGEFAYAGRRQVVNRVLDILGNPNVLDSVHNHHNFAWREEHNGEMYWVVRKGATPAFPGQRGFVGGSMGDISVILSGVDTPVSRRALYSTVHGAGRVMSRNQALKGKHEWFCPFLAELAGTASACLSVYPQPQVRPPKDMKCPVHRVQLQKRQLTPPINFRDVQDRVREKGVILRGAGPDESPEVYRPLRSVLASHHDTISVERVLVPIVVVMAGKEVHDPYKD